MDDLFRDAADNYPLKTDGGDWNAVMAKLQAAEASAAAGVQKPGGKYYRLLWLLLLTPLFFIAHLPNSGEQLDIAEAVPAATQDRQRLAEASGRQSVANVQALVPGKPATVKAPAGVSAPVAVTSVPRPEKKSNAEATIGVTPTYSTVHRQPVDIVNSTLAEKNNNTERNYIQGKGVYSTGLSDSAVLGLKSDNTVNAIAGPEALSDKATITRFAVTDTGTAAGAGMDTLPFNQSDSSIAAAPVIKKRVKAPRQVKGLYAGVIASPDISTVKAQRIARTGYGAGVIIGYRISKRLAVETGLLWDRKYYYSSGEYFNTKKLPYQPPWDIKSVNGWCNMFELPLHVRYFFAEGKKNSWYANAGLSSYIMNKESYDYSYEWNYAPQTMNRSYDNATRNWFNIMHIGVGVERPAGVLGTVRVEPYIKTSFGGVGIGSLPLTSFGINVGITRTIRF